jgi:hypothetical protein
MDRCIVADADHHMVQELMELRQPGEPVSSAYDQYIDSWSIHARHTINRDVGRVPGLAVHGQVRSLLDKYIGATVTVAPVAGAVRAVKFRSISSRIAFS